MTAFAIIIACIAFMIVVASVRGTPGRAVVDLLFGQFMDTGDAGKSVAIAFAAAFALDALYGLLAPERQRRRDKKLRRLMKRRA